MSNIRQYIGARYVFKIYENSQNPSSAEWEAGASYEALTIVTYLNSTYASKKDVPATVGDPASNPAYWIVTGAYNGQIAALQAQIDAINSAITPLSEIYYPENYGAVGDGITDDSAAILAAFEAARESKKGTVILAQKYLISSLNLNGRIGGGNVGEYSCTNFIVLGQLEITNQLVIYSLRNSVIKINTKGGGTGVLDHGNCILRGLEDCTMDLRANSVNDTAFIIGGVKPCHTCTASVYGNSCMRTLLHGSDDVTNPSQNFFGVYEHIYDVSPTYGIRFTRSSDITINHIENAFNDTTYTKNMVEFDGCWAVEAHSLALGGHANHAIRANNSQLTVGELFVVSEETTPAHTAIDLSGSSFLVASTFKCLGWLKGIYFHDLTNTMLIYPKVVIDNIILTVSSAAMTILEKDNNSSGLKTCINGYNMAIAGVTAPDADITTLGVIINGDTIHVNGLITVSNNIAAYGTVVHFPNLARQDNQIFAYDETNDKFYRLFHNSGTDLLRSIKAIPAGTALWVNYNYKITVNH